MSTLYELTEEYLILLDMMQDSEMDEQVLKDTMEAISGEIEIKADNYAAVIDNLKVVVAGINGEITEIEKIADSKKKKVESIENNIDRMKKNLQSSMNAIGKVKFKTDRHSYYFSHNERVELDTKDVNKIPEDCLSYKEPTPNKAAIKKAIKDGRDFKGIAHLETSETLVIR